MLTQLNTKMRLKRIVIVHCLGNLTRERYPMSRAHLYELAVDGGG